jgi:acyl-CoA synthetase (AMP-forming)/AMP-acid ligase II
LSDILALLEDAATGSGTVRFIPHQAEPRPFGQVWRQSATAARWMAQQVGSGGVVAGVLDSSPTAIATLIGAWRAGCAFASLPTPGRAQSAQHYADQVIQMCRLAGADVLLAAHEAYKSLSASPSLRIFTFDDACSHVGHGPVLDPGDSRLIQFTSGSTAQPKGVHLDGAAIAANVSSITQRLELGPGDACCSWLPLNHDMGLIGMCLTALAASSSRIANLDLALISPEYFLGKPAAWLRTCSELGSTLTGAPNFALRLVSRDSASSADLSRLRVLITGAERVDAHTLRSFEQAFPSMPATALCPAYGLAEATLAVTMVRPQDRWSSLWVDSEALSAYEWEEIECGIQAPGRRTELVSNGSPIPRVGARARDSAAGVGLIEVSGPSLLTRYIGANLQITGDGWFTTSDLGHVRDGELFVVARSDDVIIVGGRNYDALDLESCVTHPLVRQGNIAAVPTDNGHYALVAEVRGSPSEAELAAASREIRTDQARRSGIAPAKLVLVAPRTLPKTPSGKLQRHRVKAALEANELQVEYGVELS